MRSLVIAAVNASEWSDTLKRRVQHYNYKSKKVDLKDKIGPLPTWCDFVLRNLASRGLIGFDQLIVNEYLPG